MIKLASVLIFITTLSFAQPKLGIWRGVLSLNPEKQIELPFNFEIKTVKGKHQLIIRNAQERIVVDEIKLKKDSFNFKMPIFDTEFKTKLIGDSILTGLWINHTKKENNTIAFNAKAGDSRRFAFVPGKPNTFYEGKWEVSFKPWNSR